MKAVSKASEMLADANFMMTMVSTNIQLQPFPLDQPETLFSAGGVFVARITPSFALLAPVSLLQLLVQASPLFLLVFSP